MPTTFAQTDATATLAVTPSWQQTRQLITSDIAAARERVGRLAPVVFPNLTVTVGYRLAFYLRLRGLRRLAYFVSVVVQTLTGAEVTPSAVIGPSFQLAHTQGVVVGAGTIAGSHLTLFGGNVLGNDEYQAKSGRFGFPNIGDRVTVYVNASIIGPVSVGNDAVVGAHALVIDDVEAGAVARGVPATSARRTRPG